MMSSNIIEATRQHMERKLSGEGTGHDWWHVERVWHMARYIGQREKGADMLVVELAALLHDIADWKFHNGDTRVGPRKAADWLRGLGVDEAIVGKVAYIVEHVSYRGGTNTHVMQTLEGKIVQDADQLDALGAIGIARLFAFGGSAGRPIHNPKLKPQTYKSFATFRKKLPNNSSINHFYEKILLIKDGLHTKTAKRIGARRHRYVEKFLAEFYAEWDGSL